MRIAPFITGVALAAAGLCTLMSAPLVIVGIDNKIDLGSGRAIVLRDPSPDLLTVLDFSRYPPKVEIIHDVPNTVIGQPSNLDITPDRSLALVAQSIQVDPADPAKFIPAAQVRVIDLATSPRRVAGTVATGRQPSGLSISRDGRWALVANRADGSISVLTITGREVTESQRIQVCAPEENIADIAIAPDGTRALASIHNGGYLAELAVKDGRVSLTGRRYSVYGKPYRVVISPDGELAVSGGIGSGNGPDEDAVSVIDLQATPPRATSHIAVGGVPESIELSPDGSLLAVVSMNGSNLPAESPFRTEQGKLSILQRTGRSFVLRQEFPIGRIPQGVAFTSDGKYLVIPLYLDRQLQLFSVTNGLVADTGERIGMPGPPASIRASR